MTFSVSRLYSSDRNMIHIKAFYMIFDPKRKLSVTEGFYLYNSELSSFSDQHEYEKDM
jgi:hypothetical protein